MAFDDWLKEGTIPPPGQTPREMMNEWSLEPAPPAQVPGSNRSGL
jgi:hypothetical protein